jgi:hypothetical protein
MTRKRVVERFFGCRLRMTVLGCCLSRAIFFLVMLSKAKHLISQGLWRDSSAVFLAMTGVKPVATLE